MYPFGVRMLDLAEARMRWLERRQEVLAQNIAHADTPGYQPRDIAPFAALLRGQGGLGPARTDPAHLAGARSNSALAARPDRNRPERSPNGNAVAVDVELVKVSDTEFQHGMAQTLYRKVFSMFRVALGRAA